MLQVCKIFSCHSIVIQQGRSVRGGGGGGGGGGSWGAHGNPPPPPIFVR